MEIRNERVFPHDPELDEPLAAALLDSMMVQPQSEPPVAAATPFASARPVPAIIQQAAEVSVAAPVRASKPAPDIRPANPDQWQTIVPLERPLTVDGTRLDSITVRCLTGAEFVDLVMEEGRDEDALLRAVRGAMCGVHPTVISSLAPDDQVLVVAACRPFLPRRLQDDPDAAQIVAGALAVVD